jgi:hypothetical protein
MLIRLPIHAAKKLLFVGSGFREPWPYGIKDARRQSNLACPAIASTSAQKYLFLSNKKLTFEARQIGHLPAGRK